MKRPRLRFLTSLTSTRGQRWHGLRGQYVVAAVAILVLAVPVIMAVAYSLRNERSFILEARTLGAEIRLGDAGRGEGGDAWRLEDAIVCERKGDPSPNHVDDEDALCPGSLYRVERHDFIEVLWPPGTRIVLSYDPTGYLEIALPDLSNEITGTGGVAIAPGSVILMPIEAWRRSGALPFEARLDVGADIGPGATGFLIDGRYEARQLLVFAGLFGSSRPVTVAEARLIRGDVVRVVSTETDTESPRSFGFLTPPPDSGDEEAGFDIVAFSELAESKLEILRYGARPIQVEPRWHDAALSDPRLLAMATLGALILTLLEIVAVSRHFAGGKRPEPSPDD